MSKRNASCTTEFQVNNESVQIGCFLRRQDENNSDESVYYLRKSHIISPKDEFIDLTTEQYERAMQLTRELRARQNKEGEPAYPNGEIVRNEIRNPQNPLLLIYMLDPAGAEMPTGSDPFMGYAISFPGSNYNAWVAYAKMNNSSTDLMLRMTSMILKMKKIDKIWNELEDEQPLKSGLLYKRYSGAIKPDVYVAVKSPEKLRCIAAHLNSDAELQLKSWDKLRDIKIETLPDNKHTDKQFLLVQLLDNQHRDIFSTLSEDLIHQVADIANEPELIKLLLLRLEKWRLLFEKMGQQGLSDEAQRALYGEIYFLRKLLQNVPNTDYCVNSWKGVEKSVQDFQFSDWAVEVKTTHGKNQQKLHISSERQLDISLIPRIFLIHYSLEVRQYHGENLNDLVDDVLKMLSDSPAAHNLFRLKLLEAGYFDIHRHLYSETGYSIRQENIYKITDDFPKITENQIPSGVGDVRYSLIVSANDDWTLSEHELFENLKSE